MPQNKSKSISPKSTFTSQDNMLFGTLMLTALVMVLLALTFHLIASVSLHRNLVSFPAQPTLSRAMLAVTNYHTYQAPENFPPDLIKGKSGNYNASQELYNEQVGSLKFVSFESNLSPSRLYSLYRNYLEKRFYSLLENRETKDAWQMVAQRGRLSLDFTVSALPSGSVVGIYYRALK